jgi:hypothetical protein
VRSQGGSVNLRRDQVSLVIEGEPPRRPQPALENILRNPTFREAPQLDWGRLETRDAVPPGTSGRVQLDGRWVLELERAESQGRPGSLHWRQDLDARELDEASFLGISLTLRIDGQSLMAGGEKGTEYPVIVKLVVEPQGGPTDDVWQLGFFAAPPGEEWVTREPLEDEIRGVPVPQSRWVTFHSGNLLDPAAVARLDAPPDVMDVDAVSGTLLRLKRFQPGPQRLLRFELYASGHDYRSYVDEVGLWVR